MSATQLATLARTMEANLAWVAFSCVALGLWLSPITAGGVWTVLQAVTVAGFALLRYAALRARQGSSE